MNQVGATGLVHQVASPCKLLGHSKKWRLGYIGRCNCVYPMNGEFIGLSDHIIKINYNDNDRAIKPWVTLNRMARNVSTPKFFRPLGLTPEHGTTWLQKAANCVFECKNALKWLLVPIFVGIKRNILLTIRKSVHYFHAINKKDGQFVLFNFVKRGKMLNFPLADALFLHQFRWGKGSFPKMEYAAISFWKSLQIFLT